MSKNILILITASALAISACGGGGGGGGSSTSETSGNADNSGSTNDASSNDDSNSNDDSGFDDTGDDDTGDDDSSDDSDEPDDSIDDGEDDTLPEPRKVSQHSAANFDEFKLESVSCSFSACTYNIALETGEHVIEEHIFAYNSGNSTSHSTEVNGEYMFSGSYGRVSTIIGDEFYTGGAFFEDFFHDEKGNFAAVINAQDIEDAAQTIVLYDPVDANPDAVWNWSGVHSEVVIGKKNVLDGEDVALFTDEDGTITYNQSTNAWNADLQNGALLLRGSLEGHNVGGTSELILGGQSAGNGSFGGADGLVDGLPVSGGAFSGQHPNGALHYGGIWETNLDSGYSNAN